MTRNESKENLEQTFEDSSGMNGSRLQAPDEAERELLSQYDEPLLSVRNLRTYFETETGTVKAVDGVSFEIGEGEIVGLVGESGCGKSVTSLSLMDLIRPPGNIRGGEVLFEGENILNLEKDKLRRIRGNGISMIFQEPMAALNPVFTVGWQVGEPNRVHEDMKMDASKAKAVELMQQVGIPSAEDRVDSYPHQFSGGMAQRAMIAMALANEPKLLIADEPTTSLDVTIQAQILDLIQELNEDLDMSVLLITHNLGVVAEICDRVAVMYAGRIVEYGTVDEIFSDARHPYTKGLVGCVPDPRKDTQSLSPIPGQVPDLENPPEGCNFATRCPYSSPDCEDVDPRLREVTHNHFSACIWEDPQ